MDRVQQAASDRRRLTLAEFPGSDQGGGYTQHLREDRLANTEQIARRAYLFSPILAWLRDDFDGADSEFFG